MIDGAKAIILSRDEVYDLLQLLGAMDGPSRAVLEHWRDLGKLELVLRLREVVRHE